MLVAFQFRTFTKFVIINDISICFVFSTVPKINIYNDKSIAETSYIPVQQSACCYPIGQSEWSPRIPGVQTTNPGGGVGC